LDHRSWNSDTPEDCLFCVLQMNTLHYPDNRSNGHVYSPIGVSTFRIFYIICRISSKRSRVSNASGFSSRPI